MLFLTTLVKAGGLLHARVDPSCLHDSISACFDHFEAGVCKRCPGQLSGIQLATGRAHALAYLIWPKGSFCGSL